MRDQTLKWLLAANVLLLGAALWQSDALPAPAELVPALQDEPVQKLVRQAAYQTTSNGVTYTIQPLFEYDLVGLVVSKHDAKSWWDHLHREWNDNLNIVDLCVIWGNRCTQWVVRRHQFFKRAIHVQLQHPVGRGLCSL